MEQRLQLLDTVALNQPIFSLGLQIGQVSTIVEMLAPNVYEVEFSDDSGQTYAMIPLRLDQIIRLHYSKKTLKG